MRSRSSVVLAVLAVSVLFSATSATSAPELVGQWSTPFWEGDQAEPAVAYDPPSEQKSQLYPTAASAVALPDGRVLYWNGLEGSENGTLWVVNPDATPSLVNSRARVLDLSDDEPQWTIPTPERGETNDPQDVPPYATKDMFCADQKLLYDGTVLIAGGSEWIDDAYGDDESHIFDPATNSFSATNEPMDHPRWYPSLVTLGDGRVMVSSGLGRLIASFAEPGPYFSQVVENEIYDPATKLWEPAGTSQWSLPLYPRLHVLPNGEVFFGGAGQMWGQFGETPDELNWTIQRLYDPATKSWTMLGPSRYGARNGASSTLLRLEPPYDSADILLAGGTLGPSPSTWIATTLSETTHWSAQGGIENEGETKSPVGGLMGDDTQLRNRRWFGTSALLPTGEVLLLSGGDLDNTIDPGAEAAVRMAELYDPTNGTWRELSPGSRDRTYHNTAVLLPDGRVLVGGHAPHPAHYLGHDSPGTRNSNFRDATFEIYEPPYLFRGNRPSVSAVDPVDDGAAIELTFGEDTEADDIDEVVLVRLAAITHTIDADMRAVKLEHSTEGSSLVAELPNGGDGRILPPGPYYVFAMRNSDQGPVPSIAHVVMIKPESGGSVVAEMP